MTTTNKPQVLIDTEIQDILKSIAKDSVDSCKSVTRLLAEKAQQIDWEIVKTKAVKFTARSSAFCYKQYKKVDWIEVLEIIVSGFLILCRGIYLAGFHTGKTVHWMNDKIASSFKSAVNNTSPNTQHKTWKEVKDDMLSDSKVKEHYENMKDQFNKIRDSIERKISAKVSAFIPTPFPAPTPTPDPTPTPATPASTDTIPGAEAEYSGDVNKDCPTPLRHMNNASDQILEVLEDYRHSGNEKIDELLDECEKMIEENEWEMRQYQDETVLLVQTEDLIAETAEQQHQAMVEFMEPPTDLKNSVDSICTEDTDTPHPLYESFNAMTVRQLKDITGMYSKKYKKEQLIEAAIEMQTS